MSRPRRVAGRSRDRRAAGGSSRPPASACGRRRTSCGRRCSPRSTPAARSSTRAVLDLYSGTGALAIEALSRGAAGRCSSSATGPRSTRSRATSSTLGIGVAGRGRGPATSAGSSPAAAARGARSTSCSPIRRTTPPTTTSPSCSAALDGARAGSRRRRSSASSGPTRHPVVAPARALEPAGSARSAIRSCSSVDLSDDSPVS